MREDSVNQLLKGVSRSFYLSLRLLPQQMRGAASLGYLLARTSDTLADTDGVAISERLVFLESFERAMLQSADVPCWPGALLAAVGNVCERQLLENSAKIFCGLGDLPDAEAELVREVVILIISGQRLDLERFASASNEHPIAFADEAALEDYTWRVAGCVGAFWTQLGIHTLGGQFSRMEPKVLLDLGITYGKGLQLVNILRDLPADLRSGRCYLPVADAGDPAVLMAAHRLWLERALQWVDAGFLYSESLISRKLRASSVLPAMIAKETLIRMREAGWEELQTRIKIPRSRVYLALMRAMTGIY